MARIVLSDASPLIVLARIDGLVWLRHLFGQVHVPRTVHREVLPQRDKAGEPQIREAVARATLVVLKRDWRTPVFAHLGDGEAACIRAGVRLRVPALLLMDERMGRATAIEQGLQVAGTAAIIAMAKREKLIPSAAAVFEKLLQMDFRISAEVIRAALKSAGEISP